MGTAPRKRVASRGARNIAWIEAHCRIPEGKLVGKPVVLTREQRRWVKQIYDSQTRRFILSMARKNAKTALSAFLLLLHLCGPEAVPNSQLYSAARSREQAAILFGYASKVARMSPDLSQYVVVRDTAKQLFCPELGTLYRALSADASTAYGLSPAFVVHDELGQVKGPRDELYEALETASAAHENPLSIIISTQSPTDADLLSVLIDDALTGADPRVKIALYTAPLELDPFSEKAIRAANPHFDAFMNKDEVRSQAESARRMPSREANYRNLILNQRISQTSPFIPRAIWVKNCADPDFASIAYGRCYIGLDLSARNDLTALVLAAVDEDRAWHVQAEFFAPLVGLKDRALRDRAPYDVWEQQGYLTATAGASVDYETVAMRLCSLCDDYDVVQVAFDRWRIDVLQAELKRLGRELPLVPFGQGFKDMSPALDMVEAELMNSKVRHGNNPILTWCASNAIATRDPAGNRKLDKSKATGRIDGLIAMVMAMGASNLAQEEQAPIIGGEYELMTV
ncbi:terminase large subunit [Cupriavidus sp. BIC8F]|uniref:terminase large subunit n=1 Tax=Cupriavidus sp. BIC8F TaxID=3079014 RepID=UPI002916C546|nr:terminase TerL endonuclease subunit [Cupriavidus sp. BIC8F]